MAVRIGRKPEQIVLPPPYSGEQYFELQKLSGAQRADYQAIRERGSLPSVLARWVWDHAVTGFRLPDDEGGEVVWPGSPRTDTKQRTFDQLDEDLFTLLLIAFWLQNNLAAPWMAKAYQVLMKLGFEATPAKVSAVIMGLVDIEEEPEEGEALAVVRETRELIETILGGDAAPDIGESLGNSPGSSGTSSGPDDAAGSETETDGQAQ